MGSYTHGGFRFGVKDSQLNVLSVPTARSGLWHAGTVRNYHKRLQNNQVA